MIKVCSASSLLLSEYNATHVHTVLLYVLVELVNGPDPLHVELSRLTSCKTL